MPSVDISGMRFGKLVAIRMTSKGSKGPPERRELWLCRCDCDGKEFEVSKRSLTRGKTTSCGCLQREPLRIAAGQRFGRLTAIRMVEKGAKRRPERWLYRCDDGKEIEASKYAVYDGRIASCGCLQRERAIEANITHGHKRREKCSPEYLSWVGMLSRCRNPNNHAYERYGGADIGLDDPRWFLFENFIADMGPKSSPELEIDRIDNTKGYSPENCRWATLIEQANNKSDNHFLTLRDRRQTLAQWCREYSTPRYKLRQAVEKQWHPELIMRLLEIHRERANLQRAA